MLRSILEPCRPRVALVYLLTFSPAVAVLAVAPAYAAVVEPNGITVPAPPITTGCAAVTCRAGTVCEDGRCEVRLQSYFDTNGEAISETADAGLEGLCFRDRHIADRPDQAHLLAALDRLLLRRRRA